MEPYQDISNTKGSYPNFNSISIRRQMSLDQKARTVKQFVQPLVISTVELSNQKALTSTFRGSTRFSNSSSIFPGIFIILKQFKKVSLILVISLIFQGSLIIISGYCGKRIKILSVKIVNLETDVDNKLLRFITLVCYCIPQFRGRFSNITNFIVYFIILIIYWRIQGIGQIFP